MKGFVTIFALVVIFGAINAKPSYPKDETRECYGFKCPAGTVACKKISKTTDDGKNLETTVECQNADGDKLDEHTKTELNPFGSGTQFTSYSFTGNYHYSSNNNQQHHTIPNNSWRKEVNSDNRHTFNNEVESFKK